MPLQVIQDTDDVVYAADLAPANIDLDLTSDPWHLADNRASMILGRDVIHQGRLSVEGGRKPVGCTLPAADHPVVDAFGSSFYGRTSMRVKGTGETPGYSFTTTSIKKTTAPYAWPAEIVGAYLFRNGDGRYNSGSSGSDIERRSITSISTTTHKDDTINWDAVFADAWTRFHKWFILYPVAFDKRGIWVTNGRKFWLLQAGAYQQYLDLGDDAYLGERWDCARIRSNLMMFVNERYAARTIRLDKAQTTALADNSTLAGLITPRKTIQTHEEESDWTSDNNRSWGMELVTGGGGLSDGDYMVRVRAVNLDDGLESRFVQVLDSSAKSPVITAVADDRIKVFVIYGDPSAEPPPVHERWTHIEIWRTIADGGDYFLERRIEVASLIQNESLETTDTSNHILVSADPDDDYFPACSIADAVLVAQSVAMSATDNAAGWPPPRCRSVISLGGVTLCGGSGASDAGKVTGYAFSRFADDSGLNAGFQSITYSAIAVPDQFIAGDQIVIISGTGVFPGVYGVVKAGTAGTTYALDRVAGNVSGQTDIVAYHRRPHAIDWPIITSDEEIWYSRTDKDAPESFLVRVLRISRIGDVFRNMVRVGNAAAVIMAQGVHVLYFDGSSPAIETISSGGDGTPWRHSVVAYGNTVFWATPTGANLMSVSAAPDNTGVRGHIMPLDPENRMHQWFQDAYRNGDEIDASIDWFNDCVRFRRTMGENEFQCLQYCYRTKLWTLLDDDSGAAYASSVYASALPQEHDLAYSIAPDGNAFKLNDYDLGHPYDGYTVQSVLDESYMLTETKIEKHAAFSTAMVGDVLRFRSSNEAVDGVSRVIRSASVDRISFDQVPGLMRGDEFIVGAVRFRIRSSPVRGQAKQTNKTVEGVSVVAHPGPRHIDGDWPVPAGGVLTVRSYRDMERDPVEVQDREMPIYDAEAADRTSLDRVSAVRGQGTAVQFELECIEARTDIRLELFEAIVREDVSAIADVAAES